MCLRVGENRQIMTSVLEGVEPRYLGTLPSVPVITDLNQQFTYQWKKEVMKGLIIQIGFNFGLSVSLGCKQMSGCSFQRWVSVLSDPTQQFSFLSLWGRGGIRNHVF
jgi:hypothetical protein